MFEGVVDVTVFVPVCLGDPQHQFPSAVVHLVVEWSAVTSLFFRRVVGQLIETIFDEVTSLLRDDFVQVDIGGVRAGIVDHLVLVDCLSSVPDCFSISLISSAQVNL
ncbi:hypothetical protein [Haloarcula regularis]|uniref:hypothetical protein n=1 Tax=Haloarcula regularis TaxID=3033392 RepID=UPI0023E7E279|nr:hypothetical protein [Halomicroarcula sp. SYNS111]